MNYITDLIEADLKYICSVMPYKVTMDYFKQHPKEFAKLRPGFRAKSLNKSDVIKILFTFRNRDFISSYIEKHIKRWIEEIQDALSKAKQTGLSTEEAFINVISRSAFSHNISLYFKLVEEEKSDEYLKLMTSAINQVLKFIDQNEEIHKKYNKEITEKENYITKLKTSVDNAKREIEKLHTQITNAKSNEEIMTLTITKQDAELKELHAEIAKLNSEITCLKEKNNQIAVDGLKAQTSLKKQKDVLIKQLEEFKQQNDSYQKSMKLADEAKSTVSKLEIQVSELLATNESLAEINEKYETRIDELETLLNVYVAEQTEKAKQSDLLMPYRPINMEDFNEYFKYNLNSINFDSSNEAYNLFVHYFEKVVFSGMPLLIKHAPGINLANCLANTIYGKKKVAVLTYSGKTGLECIKDFLDNTPDRVVCIAGFIGSCNEMGLLPLLEQYRNKIIILTYMYDRTLNYIPMEILANVKYINVDEFRPLLMIKDITEDPSEIKEEHYAFVSESSEENRYQRIFSEITEQCGFSRDVVNSVADSIDSEEYMNGVLLFSVLPYITKVMQMNPYNLSKRLQKYAGEFGKCPNKGIMLGWFG